MQPRSSRFWVLTIFALAAAAVAGLGFPHFNVQIHARETAAIGVIRTIHYAEVQYHSQYGK